MRQAKAEVEERKPVERTAGKGRGKMFFSLPVLFSTLTYL